MKPKLFTLAMTGIACITGLECYAVSRGIDGVTLSLAIASIASIVTGGSIKLYDWLKRSKDG